MALIQSFRVKRAWTQRNACKPQKTEIYLVYAVGIWTHKIQTSEQFACSKVGVKAALENGVLILTGVRQ